MKVKERKTEKERNTEREMVKEGKRKREIESRASFRVQAHEGACVRAMRAYTAACAAGEGLGFREGEGEGVRAVGVVGPARVRARGAVGSLLGLPVGPPGLPRMEQG